MTRVFVYYIFLSPTQSTTSSKKIDTRIQSRLKLGLIDEIKKLLTKYKWTDPGLNTLAYLDFRPYFVETRDRASLLDICIKNWQIHEHQYARRQITWFKKFTPNYYINISKSNFQNKIYNLVSKWYNKL